MRRWFSAVVLCVFAVMGVCPVAGAFGIEAAIGGWWQSPGGTFSYKKVSETDDLDLERDLGYDDETRLTGRVKVDMPLLFPNIYLMVAPMKFDGTGQKDVSFKFGDMIFNASVPFTSDLTLDHVDIAFYYGIPFLKTATAGMLNVELGLNVRIIDLSAKIRQDASGIEESADQTLPVPMVYLAAQLQPLKKLALEGEIRGISYSGNDYYSVIGRLRYDFFGPLFAAGGYRYDKFEIDEEDVIADVDFSGPFLEMGFKF